MTVETGGTGIVGLNSSYPAGGDTKSEGDNHIRLVKAEIQREKAEIQREFPNFVASTPVTSTQAQLNTTNVTAGTATASKAVVLDASKNISTINQLTATTLVTTNFTLGGTAITSTGAELNILDGVTATTAELNILDGVTATAAELNYADGPNTANKFCLLNGSADVPLAQIPDTLTGKDAELHNGLYVQSGTTTLASTANGAVSAVTDIALTNITTVYGVMVMGIIDTQVLVVSNPSASGLAVFNFSYIATNSALLASVSTPASGNVRFSFYNNTGITTTNPISYIIYGT